jgi:hypothetical protein
MNTEIVFPKVADMQAARQIALDAEDERWYRELLSEAHTRLTDALQSMRRGGHPQSFIRMQISHGYNCHKELPMADVLHEFFGMQDTRRVPVTTLVKPLC